MSLTSLLSGSGPVRDWFQTRFPGVRSFCTAANRELRGGPSTTPCVLPSLPGADHGLVGTTVGYVISACLREDALERSVATDAAARLDATGLLPSPDLAGGIEREVVTRIGVLEPWRSQLNGGRWLELCRLCGVLARFEQCFRAAVSAFGIVVNPVVLEYTLGPVRQYGGNVGALAIAMLSPASLEDAAALGRAAVEDHGHIKNAEHLHIGPTFAQSGRLGGADADIIYDGTLIDFKSTTQAQIIGRQEAWQLLGYLLADTGDQYRIERVGIGALRRRRTAIWEAQDYVDALADVSGVGLGRWRTDFAELLESL